MKIETKKISDLIPASYNPRKDLKPGYSEFEKLKRSIEEFGYVEPVIWNKTTGHVVGGHQRLKVLTDLGRTEIDCVVVELDDAKEKALNIALNKISGDWDNEKLFGLLDELKDEDFDITLTGFDVEDLMHYKLPEIETGYFGDERERTYNEYRLYEYDETRVAGYYQFPTLKACHCVPDELLAFHYARSYKQSRKGVGIHFYIDDYHFSKFWTNPYEIIERLRGFECVLTPDFSTYIDMPMAMKIWNLYRARLLGQVMQDAGFEVIPNIRYFGDGTLDFCLEGIEPGGVVSFSTVGIYGRNGDKEIQELWIKGLAGTIEKLKPECVLIYGRKPDYDFGSMPVKYFESRKWIRSK